MYSILFMTVTSYRQSQNLFLEFLEMFKNLTRKTDQPTDGQSDVLVIHSVIRSRITKLNIL